MSAWRGLVTAILLVVAFVLRATVMGDPGPLFLVPTLLGAVWFGRRGGVLAAVAAAALYAGARTINPGDALTTGLAALLRLAAYSLVGYVVGRLSEQRQALSRVVQAQRLQIGELRGIQQAIAPRHTPRRPSLELASCYVPAQQGAAGDFYLVTGGPRDTTIVVVGDVAGKGMEAARRAAFVRTAFATSAPFTDDPCRLLELANSALLEQQVEQSMFVTCACIVFSPSDRTHDLGAGGPPAAALARRRLAAQLGRARLPARGGAPAQLHLGQRPRQLGRRADGVHRRAVGGEARWGRAVRHRPHRQQARLPARGVAARVVRELRRDAERFAGGALPDDLCIVALRAS